MPRQGHYIFVLWGAQFDERVATTFITELRTAGLRVKVVGLIPPQIRGAHGLALVPDLTLDQALALAARLICLIIPYNTPHLDRLRNDPRLDQLFTQAISNRATFVMGELAAPHLSETNSFTIPAEMLLVYPEDETLVSFTHQVVARLPNAI